MHYQLFVPHDPGPEGIGTSQQALERLGLGDFIQGHEAVASKGPDGKQGHLICWRKTPAPNTLQFSPDSQTWIPAVPAGDAPAGRYWVGFWNDSPVVPEDLQRPYSHPGNTVELGDGNSWRFPNLQQLPKDMVLADDGTWKFELQRKYHDLWLEASEKQEQVTENDSHNLEELVDFAMRCLSQNYRLTREVVSHLRLFNTRNIADSLCALLALEVVS